MSDDADGEIEGDLDQKSRPINVFRDLLAQWMPCDRVSCITLSVVPPLKQCIDASAMELLEQRFSELVSSLSQFVSKGMEVVFLGAETTLTSYEGHKSEPFRVHLNVKGVPWGSADGTIRHIWEEEFRRRFPGCLKEERFDMDLSKLTLVNELVMSSFLS